MRSAVRKTRSFSLDPEVLSEVQRTKGSSSASERVNHLLKYALDLEHKAKLFERGVAFLRYGAS